MNPKKPKLYHQSKAEALEKVRAVEKDFLLDVAALFKQKTKATEDFIEFFRSSTEKSRILALR